MKPILNEIKLRIPATGANEALARSMISVFASELNPTVEELGDLRCAVSEAVTNCIGHAYKHLKAWEVGHIYISARIYEGREVTVEIADNGCGIEDVELARTPSYTTGEAGERCGMGFLVMESFTDSLKVKSKVGRGTVVLMKKRFRS